MTQLLRVDEKNAQLYFLGVGREKGRDPYFIHFYRVGFDGKESHAADAGGCQSRRDAFALRQVFRRQLLQARRAAGRRAARRQRQADRAAGEGRHLEAARHRLEAARAVHREGARRRHRSLRPDVQAHQFRPDEEVSDRQPHLSRSADRQRGQPQFLGRARRLPGAGRARVHRGGDRRHGHAVALQEIPRGLLRQHGRQHAARSGGRHEAAGAAVSVDRYRPRRHLRPLGRRLRDGRRDVPLSRFLQGGDLRGRQSRQSRVRRRLGGEVAGAAEDQSRTARPTTTTRPTRLSPRI